MWGQEGTHESNGRLNDSFVGAAEGLVLMRYSHAGSSAHLPSPQVITLKLILYLYI